MSRFFKHLDKVKQIEGEDCRAGLIQITTNIEGVEIRYRDHYLTEFYPLFDVVFGPLAYAFFENFGLTKKEVINIQVQCIGLSMNEIEQKIDKYLATKN